MSPYLILPLAAIAGNVHASDSNGACLHVRTDPTLHLLLFPEASTAPAVVFTVIFPNGYLLERRERVERCCLKLRDICRRGMKLTMW